MPKYCFDTSGLSGPNHDLPPDIHTSMWDFIREFIATGHMAVTKEIFDEMTHIDGGLGEFINAHKDVVLYEVEQGEWDWNSYLEHTTRMQNDHKQFISEYIGGSTKTVCLNDLSIIALAKTLAVPVVSMEHRKAHLSETKRRIPDICDIEDVEHFDLNGFLRAEKFTS